MQTNKTAADTSEIFLQKLTEVMIPAMNDVETSLAKVNFAQEQLTTQMDEIKREVSQFAAKLDRIEVKAPLPDTTSIEVLTINWYQKILSTLESFPKKHYLRILLFPEFQTVQYLKTLWKVALVYLLWIVITLSLYSLGIKWMDKHYAESRYKEAWKTIYLQQNQKGKKRMDQELNRH